ncbi:FKBP-type peptidyl-prolyl cis-trans isomerase [Mucinivorans hirudinis]|uniref:Peptidyl-prolyl cis-trans isomerase n=1 Tax=Mucinivorans hirudinis TaxID=1433126 RepID=A0A060R7R1_9BACT|nr:FKBP-type peptidyl-prolyl cis-trans isomerase [Mucinivorans hirudinis]
MKKQIIIAVLAIASIFTSCSGGGASLKTQKDSVSYAIGMQLGGMAFGFDSTINVEAVVAGVRSSFAKDSKFTAEQAQNVIQLYAQVKQEADMIAYREKHTKDSIANAAESKEFLAKKEAEAGFTKTESGLIYKIENPGSTPKVNEGDEISVNFTLYNAKGEKIQSNLDFGTEPMKFPMNSGMIKGFVEGATLIGKGGKITMVLPAELAYGTNGNGRDIGPESALMFEVEVIDITPNK